MALRVQPEAVASAVEVFLASELGYEGSHARASIGDRIVTVVMQHPLSPAERRIIAHGDSDGVRQLRAEVLMTMQAQLGAIVEHSVGEPVTAFVAASHIDPDFDVMTFVLAEPSVSEMAA